MFVLVCFVFIFAKWLILWIDLTNGLLYEKRFEMCNCLWPEFDCPEVTLCGWQDVKIQLLTNYPSGSGHDDMQVVSLSAELS